MVANHAADRSRRTVAAMLVVGVHAALIAVAVLVRVQRDEPSSPLFITQLVELPPTPPEVLPEPVALEKPSLQEFTPSNLEPQLPEIDPVESVAPEAPTAAPPSAPSGTGTGSIAGDGRGAGSSGLVVLKRVIPAYPRVALKRGERGITQMLLHVMPDGRVDQVKVERSSGSQPLDDAAVEAFGKWRFQRLPDGSTGVWVRTSQRFVLYPFTYSRLDAGALDQVYEENLKPKDGLVEEATPGAREALLRFIGQIRAASLATGTAVSARELATVRANLAEWGEVKAVKFTGLVGSARWQRHGMRAEPGRIRSDVEVSWNTFEVRHESGTSDWLVAIDHRGEVWAAQMARLPE